MRIKCPNCHNTLTVEMTWEDTDVYSTIHTREYKCKCGCEFEVNFTATDTKILHKPIDKNEKV